MHYRDTGFGVYIRERSQSSSLWWYSSKLGVGGNEARTQNLAGSLLYLRWCGAGEDDNTRSFYRPLRGVYFPRQTLK